MALGSIRTRRANMVRSVDLRGHGIGASSQHVKVSDQPAKSNSCDLYTALNAL
jgi:hypothetical protein